MKRRVIFEIVAILVVSVLLSLGSSLLRPEALSWVAREKPQEEVLPEGAAYKLMSISQAGQLHAQGSALFVDARSSSAFEQGHVAGALNLEPFEFDQWSRRVSQEIDSNQVIITYCDGPQCPLASQLAERLTWLGFEQVYFLKDGWSQWQAAGLPVQKQD
jgi:rhodanese-related sulfurtransferase